MAPKKKLTDYEVKNAKPTEKEYYLRDRDGFVLRVRCSGSKSFYYIYDFHGKRNRLHLGSYPETSLANAKDRHRDALQLVGKGIDPKLPPPVPELPPEVMTVRKLKSNYIEHIATHLVDRSVKHQSSRLEKHLLPLWGDRPLESIRRRDAIALIEGIANKGKPGAARNVLLAARAMFTYALHREMVEFNPFADVGAAVPQAAAGIRERHLSEKEVSHVWSKLSDWKMSESIRRSILLILVTAQRPGEVAGLHRREIDETGKWWTIPKERSKNGRENRVYLTPLARKLLPAWDGYLFPMSRGGDGPVLVNTLSHHLIYYCDPPCLGLDRWTPHDLRRTAATHLSSLGCSDEVIDEILNHKKRGVIGTYNKNRYDKEKRCWLIRWSWELRRLIRQAKVDLR